MLEKLRQGKEKHPLLYVILFVVIYFTWFFYLEKHATPAIYVHSTLDDFIPFCEYFIVPYVLWYFYISIPVLFFLIFSRKDFFNICRYMFTGMIICLVIYTIIPTGLTLRPELTDTNIFSRVVAILYSADTSTNVCPSIHVFNSIAMHTVIAHSEAFKDKKYVHVISFIITILICMSTVFLKQHSIIDVMWGCVLAIVLYPLSYRSVLDADPAGEYNVHVS